MSILTDSAFIEKQTAKDNMAYVQAMKILYPEQTWGVLEFDGGAACHAGDSPFTTTLGFGLTEAMTKGLMAGVPKFLDDLEQFFNQHGVTCILTMAGTTDESIIRMLIERGYKSGSVENVLRYISGSAQRPGAFTPTPAGIRIED